MRSFVSALALMSLSTFTAQAQSDGKFFEPDPITLTEAVFQSMDVNLNGTLSAAEIEFYFRYLSLVLDENDDGRVTPPEFSRTYTAMMPVPIEMLSDGETKMESEFSAFDADTSGDLTVEEIVGRYAAEIGSLDKDGNALITLDEYADFSMIGYFNALEEQFLAEEQGA